MTKKILLLFCPSCKTQQLDESRIARGFVEHRPGQPQAAETGLQSPMYFCIWPPVRGFDGATNGRSRTEQASEPR